MCCREEEEEEEEEDGLKAVQPDGSVARRQRGGEGRCWGSAPNSTSSPTWTPRMRRFSYAGSAPNSDRRTERPLGRGTSLTAGGRGRIN